MRSLQDDSNVLLEFQELCNCWLKWQYNDMVTWRGLCDSMMRFESILQVFYIYNINNEMIYQMTIFK